MKLKQLAGIATLSLLLFLSLFWFAQNQLTLVFSIAAAGYPQNLLYVFLNLMFLGLFVLFMPFRKKAARLPSSIYIAFIVALYIEMYGFPLTMYIISWLFGFSNPGNLWYLLSAAIGKDAFVSILFGFMLPLSNTLILVGILLVFFGWKRIYSTKNQLVTTGIYRTVRHPQYLGFLLITLGINVLWVTLSTLLLYPALVVLYYRLAKEEDKEMEKQFGEEYNEYKRKTPMFIPHMRKTTIQHAES